MRVVWFLKSIGLEQRQQATLAICLLWVALALPNVSTRSFIWEEGTNAEIARSVLNRGEFLVPYIYGQRWAEKPSLLPWLIAGVAEITGQVNEWSARLPSMLAVLFVTLLTFRLGVRYMSLSAALFAAIALLCSPIVLQKLAIAEPDVIITLLSFATFVLWWNGAEAGRVGTMRWAGCGLLLAILAMAKGPQPAAFFVLGAGGYILARRLWREIPGFCLCLAFPAAATVAWAVVAYLPGAAHVWLAYMRLVGLPGGIDYLLMQLHFLVVTLAELLPAAILLPFFPWRWLRPGSSQSAEPVALALALYGIPTSLILLFWPRSEGRYVMPAVPALVLLAGFAWDQAGGWLQSATRRLALATAAALALYQFALVGIAMPLYAARFGAGRTVGQQIAATIAADPAPAFCLGLATNQLFYLRSPIRCLDYAEARGVTAPAWLVVTDGELAEFSSLHPGVKTTIKLKTTAGPSLMAVYIER